MTADVNVAALIRWEQQARLTSDYREYQQLCDWIFGAEYVLGCRERDSQYEPPINRIPFAGRRPSRSDALEAVGAHP